jgi:hypothetical protein
MTEQFGTSPKKTRGMAQASLDLIEAMAEIAEKAQPITGRGVGYKLFAARLIPSMADPEMKRVYRLLKEARERGMIDWDWIVDEARDLEKVSAWDNPERFLETVRRSYRRNFWAQQPVRVECWSEKGTVRGVLAPVLDSYGVGFRVLHGFSGATTVHDVSEDFEGRPLIILYVGDYDPSGMYMSEEDLPKRFEKYGGNHILLRRIALRPRHLAGLSSFPVSDKKDDTRYQWFVDNYGKRCFELDALDPNELREIVRQEIESEIEPEAWNRCVTVQEAEQQSISELLDSWRGAS